MSGSQKRMRNDVSSFKRKKIKTVNTDLMDPEPKVEEINSDDLTAELLTVQTIRESMLLLGCITEVKATSVLVSLPGYLSGIVPANNISHNFTKTLTDFVNNSNSEEKEPSIDSIITVGMIVPCKVIQILKESSKSKSTIILSINPQDVNADLKPSSLYSKMVLYVSVCSIEDHGYIVDVGNKCIQGFLPKKHSKDESRVLRIGEVIPTYVKKITISDKFSAKIQLSKLNFGDPFPEVSGEDIKLSSLLPGTKLLLDVIEVKHPFVYMKFSYFDACANVLSLGRCHKSIKVGSTIRGTVLYVHPITHMIYVMLSLTPSPDIFDEYFGMRKFETVKNLKFQLFYKNRAYFKISKGTCGFINSNDLPSKGCELSLVPNNISKACVQYFHYMDNLVQMTANPSIVEQNIILPEKVQVGDVYEAVVKKHVDEGMFVNICPGLFGFVRQIHMSDVFVTRPELIHPSGSKVKCRVLSTDGRGKLKLTCQESLVNLEERYILSSYDITENGQFYKGVVVKKADSYIIVLFFNDVKGIALTDHIPKGSVFYEGQIVLCKILHSNPLKKKLSISLETKGWCSSEELDNVRNDISESNKVATSTNKKNAKTLKTEAPKTDSKRAKSLIKDHTLLSEKPCKKINNSHFDSHKLSEAVIKNVKGGHLDILLDTSRGRVHITELGCVTEGIHPLKEFSSGQKISVHVIREYERKSYLKISNKNIFFKECSLNLPSALQYKDLKPGTSLIGFIKEVRDVNAVLWLSPTEIGVLDYLHFSENQKVLKKIRRCLKVGLSLKVSILMNQRHSEKIKGAQAITLTRIEENLPQVGKNVLGLVQIGCLDRGLILKLPFGFHGVAAVTDLTDVYAPLQNLLDKCRKLKYVLCHVLDVNHQSKYCQVSLRKSRLCNKTTSSNIFCPEVFLNNVKEGDTVKGFVKSVSNSALRVVFGRNLEGKIFIHDCSITDCSACSASKNIRVKYSVGSVVQVNIEEMAVQGKPFILALADYRNLDNSRYNRLSIKEDISWDELE